MSNNYTQKPDENAYLLFFFNRHVAFLKLFNFCDKYQKMWGRENIVSKIQLRM